MPFLAPSRTSAARHVIGISLDPAGMVEERPVSPISGAAGPTACWALKEDPHDTDGTRNTRSRRT